MAELGKAYQAETRKIIDNFVATHDGVDECAAYGMTEFLGTSNACVCSRMGHTEAANIMRDGLLNEFLHSGRDDLQSHRKYIDETWNKPGGGIDLISLIARNGMECPGPANDLVKEIAAGEIFLYMQ
jgi:hypothetical protein